MNESKLVLGTWKLGENPGSRHSEIEALQYALNHGITHIDTAEMYGEGKSEALVGDAIRDFERSSLHITTKVYPWNANRENMRNSLSASLERLGTSYVDLYLLHWLEDSVDLAEVVMLLETFKSEGLIREWGVSNFDADQMESLHTSANGMKCFANQVLYNIESRGIEFDLIPWMDAHHCQLMVYSVLGHSEAFRKKTNRSQALQDLAIKHNATRYQIMLAFVMRIPGIWAIAKAGSIQNMIANIHAASIVLDEDDIQAINTEFAPPLEKTPLQEI